MIIGINYQFIHLHKCAGTSIAHLLMTYFNGQRHGGIHNSENVNNQPIIGCIRNPYSWYVSLWAYGLDGKGQLYAEIFRNDFEKISEFYTHSNDYAAFGKWIKYLILNKKCGLLTSRFKKLYYRNDKCIFRYIIRQEHLEEDLKSTMYCLGYNATRLEIDIPYKNVSFHDKIEKYYGNSEVKELLFKKEIEIFSQFY